MTGNSANQSQQATQSVQLQTPREQQDETSVLVMPEVGQEQPTAATSTTWKSELRMLFKLAGPTIVQTASQQAMVFVDQIFLGHLGTEEMAAAALGNMYAAFLSFFLFGTATALDTLGSQAYGAQKRGVKGTRLETWTYTSFAVMTMLCVPVTVGLALGNPVARGILGQGAEIAHLMARFCDGLIPGIWPLMWSMVLMKYLQVQNVVLGPALVTASTFALNIAANFVFIKAFGFQGAPLATSFSRLIQFIAMAVLVYFFEHTQGRRGKFASFIFQGADADITPAPAPVVTPVVEISPAPFVTPIASPEPRTSNDLSKHHGESTTRRQDTAKLMSLNVAYEAVQNGGNDKDGMDYSDSRRLLQGPASDTSSPAMSIHVSFPTPDDIIRSKTYPNAVPSFQQPLQHSPKSAPVLMQAQIRHDYDEDESTRLLQHATNTDYQPTNGHAIHALGIEQSNPSLDSQSDIQAARRHMTLKQLLTFVWQQCRQALQPSLLWTYLKLGLPGGVMMSCEQGAFDVTTALAGRLGPATTSAHSAMINIVGLTFVSCPFAVGIAGSIRVGNLLGSGHPFIARMSSWLCVAIGGLFMATFAVIILATKGVIGHVFSSDPEVIRIMSIIAPMCALFQVSDGLMGTAQGALRGCGKQRLLMVYNIVGFWVCGVLLGYLLCFQAGQGVTGLWWGIAAGDTATSILNVVTLSRVNWEKEAMLTQKRLGLSKDVVDPVSGMEVTESHTTENDHNVTVKDGNVV